jgi:hypothetical protein
MSELCLARAVEVTMEVTEDEITLPKIIFFIVLAISVLTTVSSNVL